MAFTTFRLLLIGNASHSLIIFSIKRILSKIILSLSITSVLIATTVQAKPCSITPCLYENAKDTGEVIKEAVEKFPRGINVGVHYQPDLNNETKVTNIDQLKSLVGITAAEYRALLPHTSGELQETVKESLQQLEKFSLTLDGLTERRIALFDGVVDNFLKDIAEQTLELHYYAKKLILTTSNEVENLIKTGIKTGGIESRDTIRTAKDELAKLIGLTSDEVEDLLSYTSHEFAAIIGLTGDELAHLTKLASDEAQKTIKVGGDEARAVVSKNGDELRLSIDHAKEASKDITYELGKTSKDVINFTIDEATFSIREIISETSKEIKEIIEVVQEGHINAIKTSEHAVITIVVIIADRVLAVGSIFVGIIFLFISSYHWSNHFLNKGKLPDNCTVRIIVFSFMVINLVVSCVPFIFLSTGIRTSVLSQLNQVENRNP